MRKQLFILLILVSSVFCFSQKSELVFKSKNNHNYAIGKDYYVENNIDTARLMHMATIKIVSSNQDVFVFKAHNLLVIKVKEFNGNCYKLRSHSLADTTLTMLFDVYFASEKQQELMKQERVKEKIIVFNNIKDTIYRKIFLNKTPYDFARKGHLEINNILDKTVVMQLDTTFNEIEKEKMKKGQKASFCTIKLKQDSTPVPIAIGGAVGGVIGAVLVASTMEMMNKNINPRFERFSNLSYNLGRILMEIYPLDKQISIP